MSVEPNRGRCDQLQTPNAATAGWSLPLNVLGGLGFNERVTKHLNRTRFFDWGAGLGIPVAIGLSLLADWHESVVGQIQPKHLVQRGVIAAVPFGFVLLVVYYKAVRPTMRKARQEQRSKARRK